MTGRSSAIFGLTFFTLVLVTTPGTSQDLQMGGYFEHQLYPQDLGGEISLLDYNKLRLDLDADAADNLSFSANIVFQTYHGQTVLSALDYMPAAVIAPVAELLQLTPEELRPLFSFEFKDEIYIDNAYATYYGPGFNVRAGKQQIPWGTGYAWNPTDIFHDKNLLDPTYEKRGANAIKLEIPIGGMSQVTAVVSPRSAWNESSRAIRFTSHISGFDVSLMAGLLDEEELAFPDDTFSIDRSIVGGDFSGELGGLGIWFEGAYNWMENLPSYEEILAGMDYTFENGLYLMSEYYRYGAGATRMEDYTFFGWMNLISTEGENLGRDYILGGNTWPLSDLSTWSNFALVNLSDGSAIVYPYFLYSVNDNTELTLIGYVPLGKEGSEFGTIGAGGILRLRVYF